MCSVIWIRKICVCMVILMGCGMCNYLLKKFCLSFWNWCLGLILCVMGCR